MTRDEAQLFCDNRRTQKDMWENKDTHQQCLSLAYWFWHEKKNHRVFEVGSTLEEVVAKCVDTEGDIKAGKPKEMKAPALVTPAADSTVTVSCNHCGFINYPIPHSGPNYCIGCGCQLP